MKSFLPLIFCLFSTANAFAQIVMIERERIANADTNGYTGNLGLSLNLTKAKKQLTQITGDFKLQSKRDRDLWLLVSRLDYVATNTEAITGNAYIHLRYNHKFSKSLRWEAFTQWQTNPILSINQRILIGSGPRFKLADDKNTFALYLGIAYMYEYTSEISSSTSNINRFEHRNTNYLSFTWTPNKTTNWTTTAYFQPLIANTESYNPVTFNDFRVAGESSLRTKIHNNLSFSTTFRFLYNRIPPPNTPDYTYNWTNGFNWSF